MMLESHRLANGLEILGEPNPQAYSTSIGVFVRTGSRDEQASIGGVSHFLEHMVFKGTPRRSAEQVNRELDELGAHSNARTGEENTIYHASVLPEFQGHTVELLADLMRPSLRVEDFETEKQVIIEEIMMYDDQPPYGGHERLMAEFFGAHPLAQSILGSVDTVGQLTAGQMQAYFDARYSPANMAIVATGKVDFAALVGQAEQHCGHWTGATPVRARHCASPRSGLIVMHKPQSTQQYILQLTPGPDAHDPRRFAARLVASILGDDGGSRMYWQFIDTGHAEAAVMGTYEFEDAGAFASFVCCAPQQAQANLDALRTLQRRATLDGVTERELELAKRKITSHIYLTAERAENRMFAVGGQWLRGQPYRSPRQVAESFDAVTLADIRALVDEFPLDQGVTLTVGPLEQISA
jgi:predicted Zn-dependent peptidase